MTNLPTREEIAEFFHETYERLAPQYGYKTRATTAVPWSAIPSDNRALMIAVADALLARLRPAWERMEQTMSVTTLPYNRANLEIHNKHQAECPYCIHREAVLVESKQHENEMADLATKAADRGTALEAERDALRADVTRLERQVNASVPTEVYAAQAETVTQLRENLRACAEALFHYGVHFAPCVYGGTTARVGLQDQCSCGLSAALARPGVVEAGK